METYITFAFLVGIIGLIVRSINLVGEHPRIEKYSIGTDTLSLIASIVLLAWVTTLKFWGG